MTYSKPFVIGVDYKNIGSDKDVVSSVRHLGQNSGNMVFSESLYRLLKNARRATASFRPEDTDGCDVIVLAAANWIYQYVDMSVLVSKLERASLPVVIIGLGAQSDRGERPFPQKSVKRLLDISKDSGSVISSRGTFTTEVIHELGDYRVQTTGCPSLLLSNGIFFDNLSYDRINKENACFLGTRHHHYKARGAQKNIYKLAFENEIDLILQSETFDMMIKHSIDIPAELYDEGVASLIDCYGMDDFLKIASYIKTRSHIFLDLESWISYLKSKKYVLTSRIHGAVAGLISGRRSILVPHDSRTYELAISMGIPFIEQDALTSSSIDVIFESIMSKDFSITETHYPIYKNKFLSFFNENGLKVNFQ